MTTFNLTCEAVEATLADYLDETLEPWLRTAVEDHLAGCARCTTLAHELRNIARELAALPRLLPEQDVWPKVAARIGAPGSVSEPVEEITPPGPVPERVVFSSDTFLPIGDEPGAPEEPPVLATDSRLTTSDPRPLTSELTLASAPAGPTMETPAPPKEGLVPRSEPASVEHEVPVPTPAPLPLAIEPAPRSRTAVPKSTTAPAPAPVTRRVKPWGPVQIALAAAALVLVTATTSSVLTVKLLGRTGTPSVATTAGAGKASSSEKPASSENPPSTEQTAAEPAIRRQSTNGEPAEPDLSTPTPGVPSALTASAPAAPAFTPSPEEVVYGKEINTLSRIVSRKKSRLEPSTVTVIDKNLGAVDSALAQIRSALEDDPSNPLLDAQASRALEMKVELLRRAAMMRSTTSL